MFTWNHYEVGQYFGQIASNLTFRIRVESAKLNFFCSVQIAELKCMYDGSSLVHKQENKYYSVCKWSVISETSEKCCNFAQWKLSQEGIYLLHHVVFVYLVLSSANHVINARAGCSGYYKHILRCCISDRGIIWVVIYLMFLSSVFCWWLNCQEKLHVMNSKEGSDTPMNLNRNGKLDSSVWLQVHAMFEFIFFVCVWGSIIANLCLADMVVS